MSVNNCPSCNNPVPPGSIFCDNCGYDLRSMAAAGAQPVAPTYHVPEPGPEAAQGSMVCATCGHTNIAGSAFCESCGSQLSQAAAFPQQAPAPSYPAAPAYTPPVQPPPPTNTPAPAYVPPVQPPPAPPAAAATVVGRLVIQASNVSLPIPQGKQTVLIGREDPVSGIFPEIDLDPYGAQEEGVGRRHAQLVAQGGQIFVEDLDSVNGTFLNRQKVPARQPRPLQNGDELRFGKMILIYHAS